MTQLLSLLNQAFGNQSKNNDLKQHQPSKVLKTMKTIQNVFITIYDSWIETRLEQAKHYNKHNHIE